MAVELAQSQKFGWHGADGSDGVSQPIVPRRHAMKRLGELCRKTSCPETEYAADFVMSFGTSIFAPKAKITKD